MALSEGYLRSLHSLNYTFASLGTFFCLIYLLSILFLKDKITIKSKKALNITLTLACLSVDISYFFGTFKNGEDEKYPTLCKIQAILTTFGGLLINFLIVLIIIVIYLIFSYNEFIKRYPKFFNYGLIIFPIILSLSYEIFHIIFEDTYRANSNGYCIPASTLFVNIYGYTIFSSMIIIIFLLFYISINLTHLIHTNKKKEMFFEGTRIIDIESQLSDRESESEENRERVYEYLKLFIKYFIVQIYISFFFFFDLIKRKINFKKDGKPFLIWNFIVQTGYAEIPLIVILIYGYNNHVWLFFRKIICCYYFKNNYEKISYIATSTDTSFAMETMMLPRLEDESNA